MPSRCLRMRLMTSSALSFAAPPRLETLTPVRGMRFASDTDCPRIGPLARPRRSLTSNPPATSYSRSLRGGLVRLLLFGLLRRLLYPAPGDELIRLDLLPWGLVR